METRPGFFHGHGTRARKTERAAPWERPARSKEMVRLGMEIIRSQAGCIDPWGCPQAMAPLTVPTPFSNITLDTGPPPFNCLPL